MAGLGTRCVFCFGNRLSTVLRQPSGHVRSAHLKKFERHLGFYPRLQATIADGFLRGAQASVKLFSSPHWKETSVNVLLGSNIHLKGTQVRAAVPRGRLHWLLPTKQLQRGYAMEQRGAVLFHNV
jgi:hypothetical protein